MKEIEKYMFLMEAALKYNLSYETLKSRVKTSRANQKQLQDMIDRGIIRYFEPPRDANKEYKRTQRSWLVTEQAIKEWFPTNSITLYER
ncbi:DNA-binding protein [Bacillus thuringiensis]|nr:DNA-binding protein [Bacillus thuringiensis]